MQFEIKVQTQEREVINITEQIQGKIQIENGLCNVFLQHSSAALTISDMDPGMGDNILKFIEKQSPTLDYKHHDPDHTPDHIWSAIIGTSITIPIKNGKLNLGTWQKVVLIEFNGPRERDITVQCLKG